MAFGAQKMPTVPGWKSVNQGGYNPQANKKTFGKKPAANGGLGGAGNTDIYSGQQTQEATNLSRAYSDQKSGLPYLLNQYGRQGMSSYSPAMQGKAMKAVGDGQVQSAAAGYQIPFSDDATNAANRTSWQDFAEQSKIGRQGVQNRLDHINRGYDTSQFGNLAQILSSFGR